MTREDQVRTLLRFHSQVVSPYSQKDSTLPPEPSGGESPVPLLRGEYRDFPVWCELERCLRVMRGSERRLWWHTFERYYAPRVRRQLVPFKHGHPVLSPFEALFGESQSKAKRSKNRVYTELRLVESWSPRVDATIANEGVVWLAGRLFDGGPLFLPTELMEAA